MKHHKAFSYGAILLVLVSALFFLFKPSVDEEAPVTNGNATEISTLSETKSRIQITDSHWRPHFLEAESTMRWDELLQKILDKKIPQRTPTEGIELLFAEWSRIDPKAALAAALALENTTFKMCALCACTPNMYQDDSFYQDVMLHLSESEQSRFRYQFVRKVALLDLSQCIAICSAMPDDKKDEAKRSVVVAMLNEVFEHGTFADTKKLFADQEFVSRQKKDIAYAMHRLKLEGFEIRSLIDSVTDQDIVSLLHSQFINVANGNEIKQLLQEKPQFFIEHPEQSVNIMNRAPKYTLELIKNDVIDVSRLPWKTIDSLCLSASVVRYQYADIVFQKIPESDEKKSGYATTIAANLLERNVDSAGEWIKGMPASKHRDAALVPLLAFYRKNHDTELLEEWSQLLGGY
jgi:hypothetical protein